MQRTRPNDDQLYEVSSFASSDPPAEPIEPVVRHALVVLATRIAPDAARVVVGGEKAIRCGAVSAARGDRVRAAPARIRRPLRDSAVIDGRAVLVVVRNLGERVVEGAGAARVGSERDEPS